MSKIKKIDKNGKMIKVFLIVFYSILLLFVITFKVRKNLCASVEKKESVFGKYLEATSAENWEYIYQGKWKKSNLSDRYLLRDYKKKNKITGIIDSSAETLDKFKSYPKPKGHQILPIVYIGKWEYDKQLKKEIRLIKRQWLGNGSLTKTYETKDEKNKNILAMELSLVREVNDFFGKRISDEKNKKVMQDLKDKGYVFIKDGKLSGKKPEDIKLEDLDLLGLILNEKRQCLMLKKTKA